VGGAGFWVYRHKQQEIGKPTLFDVKFEKIIPIIAEK
jgi:hypothetical protein